MQGLCNDVVKTDNSQFSKHGPERREAETVNESSASAAAAERNILVRKTEKTEK